MLSLWSVLGLLLIDLTVVFEGLHPMKVDLKRVAIVSLLHYSNGCSYSLYTPKGGYIVFLIDIYALCFFELRFGRGKSKFSLSFIPLSFMLILYLCFYLFFVSVDLCLVCRKQQCVDALMVGFFFPLIPDPTEWSVCYKV